MIKRFLLAVLLGEYNKKIDQLKDLVARDASFFQAPHKIKVAIGMRRVRKTYFLYQKVRELLQSGIDKKSILFINFEDARLVEPFYEIFPENHERTWYVFFDEIQNVPRWPTAIRRLHDTRNVEIYLSGSLAKLLSKEIATSLRGRSLSAEICPYSFSEYIRAKKKSYAKTVRQEKS